MTTTPSASTSVSQRAEEMLAVEEGLAVAAGRRGRGRPWTFLTSHGHVLLAVAADPDARVEDVAATVGLSDRSAMTILKDLEEAGYLERRRVGRRTHYTVHRHRPFRHPASTGHEVDELIAIFASGSGAGRS